LYTSAQFKLPVTSGKLIVSITGEYLAMADNVGQVFQEIPGQFDASAWGTQDAVLQFNITGDDGGTWVVNIKNGVASVSDGPAENPNMTVTTSGPDMLSIVNGDLNAVSAFMQGRVRIEGDMSLAMKLQTVLASR
jgi:putative sterol carrier protein